HRQPAALASPVARSLHCLARRSRLAPHTPCAPTNPERRACRNHEDVALQKYSTRRALTALWAIVLVAAGGAVNAQTVINVSTAAQLQSAVSTANAAGGNRTIVLADGTYTVSGMLNITGPNITIAGQSG